METGQTNRHPRQHVCHPALDAGSSWIPHQVRDDKNAARDDTNGTRDDRRPRGFSLLEIMVVLLLVGIFTAIAVPTYRSLTGSRLKTSVNQLAGLIRDTYSRASLSSKTCRIIFDLDEKAYWVECSADMVLMKSLEEEEEEREEKRRDPDMAKDVKDPDFKAVDDELGEKQTLPEDVFFKSVWTENLGNERARKGKVALYFFPDGYTEEAQIVLSDDEDGKRLYDLVVEPLTGTVVVEDKEMPIEKW